MSKQVAISVKAQRWVRPRKDIILVYKTSILFSIMEIIFLKRKDLTGNRYGHLTVLKMLYKYKDNKHTFCECICDCGNIYYIEATKIQTRKNLSCGCMTQYYRTIHNRSDESGQKYNRLTIINIDYSKKPSMAYCKCDCGNYIWALKADVVSGHTQSCGCLQKENASKANTKDYSGVIAPNGVRFIKKLYMNEHGTWVYKCQCPLCDNTFDAIPSRILENHNTSCGCNAMSAGERIIKNILDRHGANYIMQKTFDDCKDKYVLPFDFAIYGSGDAIIALIEYDGEQHFRSVDLFGGEEAFRVRQRHDEIKDNYCALNNMPLYRISYKKTAEEIEDIITNIMNP